MRLSLNFSLFHLIQFRFILLQFRSVQICRFAHSLGVITLNLRSIGRGFNSRSGRFYLDGWPSGDNYYVLYVNHIGIQPAIKVNSAFYPSGIGESSTGLTGWIYGGHVHMCQVTGNTMW